MSEKQGYVRVVNIRADDDDFRAAKGERVIMMDRTHPSMGNRHVMKTQSRLERDRVIEAHKADLDADIARKGPMYQTMMAIAFDIVDKKEKVALQCYCAPAPCHLDLVATHIATMVKELRAEAAAAPATPAAEAVPRQAPKI